MTEPSATEHKDSVVPGSPGSDAFVDAGRIALSPIELSADMVVSAEGVRSLQRDYERLERASGNTLPFALYEWHLTWCEHLLHHHRERDDRLQLLVLRNRSGDCVALVPLILNRWHIGLLRISTVGFLGSGDAGVTEIGGALIEPGYEHATVRRVYESMSGVSGWQWLHWRDANEALAAALTLELGPLWDEAREDCVLDLPSTWQEFRAGLAHNVRESLRHGYNSLRRDGHRFELVVARTPGEVLEALPRFLELHALRATMPWGPAHRNYFASPQLQQFLHEVCGRLAARDVARVFQLRIAGAVVAAQVGFVVGDSLYMYYSGFDPAWARYGVMTTTMAEALRYAIAQGLRTVNLSPTPIRAKLRWRPRLLKLRSCIVHRETLGSRLACRAHRIATSSQRLPVRLLRHLLRAGLGWP